jgi:hypothetical protein
MKTIRMKVTAFLVIATGCSTASLDRSPSFASSTEVKLMDQKTQDIAPNRDFQSTESQDVKVCGELYAGEREFVVRSHCKQSNDSFDGVSKIPNEVLLPEAQRSVWNNWTGTAQTKNSATRKRVVPFVCFVGRGNGDPCDKKNGSMIQRVRRFTTDEQQFNSW